MQEGFLVNEEARACRRGSFLMKKQEHTGGVPSEETLDDTG
jgi:hypothetical protein